MAEDETAEKAPAINWIQVIAGSLAAVSSAVLLSTLGVAGTLVGAAMGSVVASVASTVYSRGISVSGQQVRAQASALRRVTSARSRLDAAVSAMSRGETGAQNRVRVAGEELSEAEQALQDANGSDTGTPERPADPVTARPDEEAAPTGWRERLAGLSWKRVAIVAGSVFAVAMIAITAFELSTGRAVSEFTGGSDRDRGTTIPGIRDSGSGTSEREPTEEPTVDPTATETPSDEPTESPSEEPTEVPTEGPSASPTEQPSEEPSQQPMEEPTPEAPPTADANAPAPTRAPVAGPEVPPTEPAEPAA